MDLYCPRCGEPWEMDCLHEEAELRLGGAAEYLRQRSDDPDEARKTYDAVFSEISRDFRTRGCAALREFRASDQLCELRNGSAGTRAAVASAMYDLLGSDMDGAAAMLEDWQAGR